MEGIDNWIQNWITGWDSLCTAVMILAIATVGAIYVSIRNTKKITDALDRVTTSVQTNREQLSKNHEILDNNNLKLDTLMNLFKQWDWRNWWPKGVK